MKRTADSPALIYPADGLLAGGRDVWHRRWDPEAASREDLICQRLWRPIEPMAARAFGFLHWCDEPVLPPSPEPPGRVSPIVAGGNGVEASCKGV